MADKYSHEDWAQGRALDVMPPSAVLVAELESARSEDGSFAGLSDEELIGVVGRIAACEPWLTARKAQAIAELVKRRKQGSAVRRHGLPERFDDAVAEELSAALAISRRQAQKLVDFSLSLTGRLDAVCREMLAGALDFVKR